MSPLVLLMLQATILVRFTGAAAKMAMKSTNTDSIKYVPKKHVALLSVGTNLKEEL